MPRPSKSRCAHAHIWNIPPTTEIAELEDFLLGEAQNADSSVAAVAIGPMLTDSRTSYQSTTVSIEAQDKRIAQRALQVVKARRIEFTDRTGSKSFLGIDPDCHKVTVLWRDEDEPTFDVCFVHGFHGHALKTFASKSSKAHQVKIWPRDLLPHLLKTREHRGQYMTFGYDAPVRSTDAIPQTLRKNAERLLDQLILQRGKDCKRPLFFICHSLGGLVVCQAVLLASEGKIDRFAQAFTPNGANVIQGCVFFGTPFKGNRAANLGAFLAKSLLLNQVIDINTPTLNYLSVKNKDIEEVVSRFERWTKDSNAAITTFYERKRMRFGPLKWLVSKIVEQDSAKGIFEENVPNHPLLADHHSMVKFDGEEDTLYASDVAPYLKSLIQDKLDLILHIPAMMAGQNLVKLEEYQATALGQKYYESTSKQDDILEIELPDEQDDPGFDQSLLLSVRGAKLLERADHLFFDLLRHHETVASVSNTAVDGTCDWILEKQSYQDWLGPGNQNVLFIEANPGWGKSFLFRFIVTKLREERRSSISALDHAPAVNDKIVCFSPSMNTRKLRTPELILRDILSQLAAKFPRIVRHMCRYFFRHQEPDISPQFYWNLFKRIRERISQHTYFIIDGLDECVDSENAGTHGSLDQRMVFFLQNVCDLLKSSNGETKYDTKVLFMTRRKKEVDVAIQGRGVKLSIQASDTEPGVHTFISERVKTIANGRDFPLANQEMAIESIARKCGPVYQIAHQLLLKLPDCDLGSQDDIRSTILKYRAQNFDKIYENCLEEIQQKHMDKAIRLIRFLYFAQEPMTLRELQHVLAVKIGDTSGSNFVERLQQGNLDFLLSGACGSLVRIEKNDKVFLDHESVYDFFGNLKKGKWKEFSCAHDEEGHLFLSLLCVTFLHVWLAIAPSPEELEAANYDELTAKLHKADFAIYAAWFWPEHTRLAGNKVLKHLEIYKEFLGTGDMPTMAFTVMRFIRFIIERSSPSDDEDDSTFQKMAPIDFLATEDLRFLLEIYCKPVLQKRSLFDKLRFRKAASRREFTRELIVNKVDQQRRTTLHHAASSGSLESVRYLLDCGAYGGIPDDENHSPFSLAVQNDHETVASLLFEYDEAFGQGENDLKLTTLHWACAHSMTQIVRQLLLRRANPNAVGFDGWTPVLITAQQGNTEILDLLIAAGSTVDVLKEGGAGPLYLAAANGHLSMITRLFELKNDLDPAPRTTEDLKTPLFAAAQYGHTEVFEYLLEKSPDVEPTRQGLLPVHTAATHGHLSILQLLERSPTFHTENNYGRRAIHLAAINGYVKVVKYLINKLAVDPDTPCPEYSGKDSTVKLNALTPLYLALYCGQEDVGLFLIEQNVRIDVIDQEDRTLLHHAAWKGCFEVFKILVRRGLDPLAKDTYGQTPFHRAAGRGQFPIVEAYLEGEMAQSLPQSFSVDDPNKDGATALIGAAEVGSSSVVELLLAHHADPNAKDIHKQTPLMIASTCQSPSCVALLLRKEVMVNAKDFQDSTPLHMAAKYGRVETAELLLTAHADIDAQTVIGSTPIIEAASHFRKDVFELLLKHKANPVSHRDYWGFNALDYVKDDPRFSTLVEKWKDQNVPLGAEDRERLLNKLLTSLLGEWLTTSDAGPGTERRKWLILDIGVTFLKLGNEEAARTCFEQQIFKNAMDEKYMKNYLCDLCHEDMCSAPVHICTVCHDSGICNNCFQSRGKDRPAGCSTDHKLLVIGGSEWDALQPGTVNQEGLKFEDWVKFELEKLENLPQSTIEPASESVEPQPIAETAELSGIEALQLLRPVRQSPPTPTGDSAPRRISTLPTIELNFPPPRGSPSQLMRRETSPNISLLKTSMRVHTWPLTETKNTLGH